MWRRSRTASAQIKIDSTDPEAWSHLGYAHFKTGEPQKGLDELNKALEMMKPEYEVAHEYRAEVFDAIRQHDKATIDRKRAGGAWISLRHSQVAIPPEPRRPSRSSLRPKMVGHRELNRSCSIDSERAKTLAGSASGGRV